MSKCHVSPCRSLFAATHNVATSQPRHRVFACLLMALEGLGSEFQWKWWARGPGFFHENFSQFHPHLPLEKNKFLFCLAWPPYNCLPLEHSGTKMGRLDIGPVYSTLCPSITSTCPTSKFHLNMFQYSIGGAVTPDEITYGQDCMFAILPSQHRG